MPTTSTKMEEKSRISEWYNGRSIFITGGTGFMGKVLVEKLLYTCSGLSKIYILMRPKRGNSPEKRLEEMWKLPMFSRLTAAQPNAIKKVAPLQGDLHAEFLGLSESDLNTLANNVNVVFHVAATLRLEATLKSAIDQNTAGTARVIDVALKMKKLEAFVHFSTAFCSADIDVFEEKVYECRENPRDVIEVAKWMRDDALEKATPALIAPHRHTYTYSKRLAENLVANEKDKLPVCILRPSIVIPAGLEPLPGWVDSLNGPMGLLVGAGKGVIRSMYAKRDNKANFVPVDMAIATAIIVAQKVGSSPKSKEVPVYNLSQDEVIPITIGEILEKGRSVVYANPFQGQIWYPDGDIRSSRFVHWLFCLFLHWIPAYIIDFLLLIFRQKRFMVRLQRRIHDGLGLLEFYAVRQWNFKCKNFMDLNAHYLTEADKEHFKLDFRIMSIDEYLEICVLGARQYLMKEDLSTLPRCRIQQNILMVVHKLVVYGFYFFLLWTILSSIGTAEVMFDSVGSYIKHVPVIGRLVHV